MPFDERARARYFSSMRRRIIELKAKSESSLDFAIDTMMLERAESYLMVEKESSQQWGLRCLKAGTKRKGLCVRMLA